MKYILTLGMLILLMIACRDELSSPVEESIYGYGYFPLEVGLERIYRLDSIQYDLGRNDLPVDDSSTFYLREVVVEQLLDHTGMSVYRIERFRSDDPDGPWEIFDVATQSRSTNQAFYTENNLRLINLVFPVEAGKKWDGNAFIKDDITVIIRGESIEMFKGWDYQMVAVDSTEQVGEIMFDEVLTVQQAASENAIERRYSFEKYAKGVGLVFRHREILDSYCKYIGTNEPCINKDWRAKAGRGFILRQTLVSHN